VWRQELKQTLIVGCCVAALLGALSAVQWFGFRSLQGESNEIAAIASSTTQTLPSVSTTTRSSSTLESVSGVTIPLGPTVTAS